MLQNIICANNNRVLYNIYNSCFVHMSSYTVFMGINSLVKCYYIYLCASVRPIRIDINYYNYNCKQYGNFVVYYNVCIKISASYHLVYIQHVNTLFKQIICTYVYQIRVFFIHMVHGKLYSLLLNLSCYPCTYTANVSFSYAIFYYSYI